MASFGSSVLDHDATKVANVHGQLQSLEVVMEENPLNSANVMTADKAKICKESTTAISRIKRSCMVPQDCNNTKLLEDLESQNVNISSSQDTYVDSEDDDDKEDILAREQQCEWEDCQRKFESVNALAAHVNGDHVKTLRDEEYKCGWKGCSRRGRVFNARNKMLIHVRTHTHERPHQCNQCGKSFSRLENLKIHTRSHTGERPYICPIPGCGKAYSNSSDQCKHTITHFEEKPYICRMNKCNKRYTDPSSLRKHMKTYGHYRDTNMSSSGDARSSSAKGVTSLTSTALGTKIVLPSDKPQVAGLMPTLTWSANNKQSIMLPQLESFHLSTLASNSVLSAMAVVGVKSKSKLTKGSSYPLCLGILPEANDKPRDGDESRLSSEDCSFQESKAGLSRVKGACIVPDNFRKTIQCKELESTEAKLNSCDNTYAEDEEDLDGDDTEEFVASEHQCYWEGCQLKFEVVELLATHVNEDHVKTLKDEEYRCGWQGCSRRGRGFNARYKMLIHVRTHTNERPHQCNQCGKSFSRLENLKIHTRSHTGERPYACPIPGCGKAYSNSSDRFKHTRTHFEEKPYICRMNGCNKRYTDPSSLRKHMKTYGHYRDINTRSSGDARPVSAKGMTSTSPSLGTKIVLPTGETQVAGLMPAVTWTANNRPFITLPQFVSFDLSALASNSVLSAMTVVGVENKAKHTNGTSYPVCLGVLPEVKDEPQDQDESPLDSEDTSFQASPLDLTTDHGDTEAVEVSDCETVQNVYSEKWEVVTSG